MKMRRIDKKGDVDPMHVVMGLVIVAVVAIILILLVTGKVKLANSGMESCESNYNGECMARSQCGVSDIKHEGTSCRHRNAPDADKSDPSFIICCQPNFLDPENQ